MIDVIHSVAVYLAVLAGILFEQFSRGVPLGDLLEWTRIVAASGAALLVVAAKERKGDIRGKRAHFGWRLVEAFMYGYTANGIISSSVK